MNCEREWLLKDVYLQCISRHGCTFDRSPSQRRCKQSCHGKQQPGSYHLNAQGAQSSQPAELLQHWNITISEFLIFYQRFHGFESVMWTGDILPGEYLTLEMISLPSVCIETRSRVSVSSTNHLQHTKKHPSQVHRSQDDVFKLLIGWSKQWIFTMFVDKLLSYYCLLILLIH